MHTKYTLVPKLSDPPIELNRLLQGKAKKARRQWEAKKTYTEASVVINVMHTGPLEAL